MSHGKRVQHHQIERSVNDYRIYLTGGARAHDLGEGPFSSQAAAMRFAETEVGVPWTVRKKGARPKQSDPRWEPESEAARIARGQREAIQIEQNRLSRMTDPVAAYPDYAAIGFVPSPPGGSPARHARAAAQVDQNARYRIAEEEFLRLNPNPTGAQLRAFASSFR